MAAEKDDSRIVPVHFCRVTVIFRCKSEAEDKLFSFIILESLISSITTIFSLDGIMPVSYT
ncbi:hypothetical protein, partial [Alistipes sp.]|uniref:hypothetical protein n=1 Tax=Alistipes sp. TaxID=1872444 RepID=UPI0023F21960